MLVTEGRSPWRYHCWHGNTSPLTICRGLNKRCDCIMIIFVFFFVRGFKLFFVNIFFFLLEDEFYWCTTCIVCTGVIGSIGGRKVPPSREVKDGRVSESGLCFLSVIWALFISLNLVSDSLVVRRSITVTQLQPGVRHYYWK